MMMILSMKKRAIAQRRKKRKNPRQNGVDWQRKSVLLSVPDSKLVREEKTRIEREAAELWESLCPKQSSPHVTRSTVPTTSTTTKRVSGKVHPPLETPIAGKSAKQLAEEATASAKPQKEQSVTYRFCGESIVYVRFKTSSHFCSVPQDTKRKRGADVVSLLGTSKGKKKISTLQKSSLDWQNFKSKNNLDDELEQQTKDGFLERQAFLARSDLRQFEVEKQVRNTDRRLRERKR
eukprot:TRINITY_DN4707_c0_g1_i4.p1 TRINITY_DN4707_c0_g1~~TRINITY_DN4707_c0_g1_i4.p1  ORF type:complete len:235 (+),score=41.96 TRINITY_DN4707_c0_g1_i4:119-823(+)